MEAQDTSTILIVEDDPGIAELEKLRLEDVGYRIVLAATAEEAIRKIRSESVDLIVLDYRLPGDVDGLSFFSQVQAAGFDLPVILVTGFSSEATVIRALRAGVRDFVTKSVEYLDYLPEAVNRVLRQVRTESRLAESEARLASIIKSAKDAILVTESDETITIFNEAAEKMFRCSAAQAIGQSITQFIPPEMSGAPGRGKSDPASISQRLRTGTRGIRANGEVFPLEASVSRVEINGRRVLTVVARDVSERHRAEARVREQAALLDQARDAILVRDLDDKILFWNRAAERIYGWTVAQAVGRKAYDLIYKNVPPELAEAHRSVLETGEWTGELRQVTRDAHEIMVESRQTLLRDPDGRPRAKLIINTDITEKKRLEAQLLHTQRMEAIGVLASGVAHDFNNLLTVISGYSEMLLDQTRPDTAAHGLLREIHKAGESAAALTRQLLAFGRKQIVSPQVVDVNLLIADTEKMLRRLIGAHIELTTTLSPNLGRVKADPGQIEQILINLAVNARDAMPDGGKITIETTNQEIDHDRGLAAKSKYVVLAVTDTGCGMDEATKAHIFEPFFTTKEVGKGTGLGLATVHGIVTQNGGHIDVDTAPGRGTTFRVSLPRAKSESAERRAAQGSAVPRGTETVLLVEDDPNVLELGRLALRSVGYTVLEASNGEQAVQIVNDYAGTIHLLITDVVMPRTSGRAVAEQLVLLRPSLKVLFISGYSDDSIIRQNIRESAVAFLQKPFTPGSLARKVREVLGS